MVKNARKARKAKKGRVVKEKFVGERTAPVIHPKTEKQGQYFKALRDPNVQVVVALGLHGTGKTFCAAVVAADAFRNGEIDEIIVARPYVQTGRTSGFKPGSSLEKLFPYVRTVLDTIKMRIGSGVYHNALRDGLSGQIKVQEVESIRGMSFDTPSYLILDEAQQTQKDEMISIVTRVSDRAKLCLCGDIRQKDIKGESGLEWFISFVERHNIKGVTIIDFNEPSDIVRGGLVREVAVGLMKDGEGEYGKGN